MNYDDIVRILKEKGFKITPQRMGIINTLIEKSSSLISADTLYINVKNKCDKTNRSTIYRNLEILETLQLLYKVSDNGMTLYKLSCTHDGHHHHLICKNCGKTEVLDYCPMETLQKLSKEKQFYITDHKLELYGQCSKCNIELKI